MAFAGFALRDFEAGSRLFESDRAYLKKPHDRMKRDGVAIVRPLTSAPFTNDLGTGPDAHLVQVYFDPGDG